MRKLKEPNIKINQINVLVLSKSLSNELKLLPDRITPFYLLVTDNEIKVRIVPSNHFTGCWFTPDINQKNGCYRYKSGRGNMLANVFTTVGYKPLVNYKVTDIIPNGGFTITKEML